MVYMMYSCVLMVHKNTVLCLTHVCVIVSFIGVILFASHACTLLC